MVSRVLSGLLAVGYIVMAYAWDSGPIALMAMATLNLPLACV